MRDAVLIQPDAGPHGAGQGYILDVNAFCRRGFEAIDHIHDHLDVLLELIFGKRPFEDETLLAQENKPAPSISVNGNGQHSSEEPAQQNESGQGL